MDLLWAPNIDAEGFFDTILRRTLRAPAYRQAGVLVHVCVLVRPSDPLETTQKRHENSGAT